MRLAADRPATYRLTRACQNGVGYTLGTGEVDTWQARG
jgi:hypothetical protein